MTRQRTLLPHQSSAMKTLLERSPDASRVPLFMDMRLGKSSVLLRTWREAGLKRVLLAAPSVPLVDWRKECVTERWVCSRVLRGSAELGMAASGAVFPAGKYPTLVLTTHETLRTCTREMANAIALNFDGLCVDESTVMKNPKAQLTKTCLKWLTKVRHRAVLSGLPFPQDVSEVWTQMAFVMGGSWMGSSTYWEWERKHFYTAPWDPYTKRITKACAMRVRNALHADAVMLTAEDAGVERVVLRTVVKGDMPAAAKKMAEHVKETWKWPGFGDAHAAKNSVVIAGWLHALEGGCNPAGAAVPCWKSEALARVLRESVPSTGAVVVWCNGLGEAELVAGVVRELKGRPLYVLNGSVPQEERPRVLSEWREDAAAGDGPVMVASPKLVKWGVDFSRADWQVWWSRPWSFENNRQAEARTMHPTKRAPTQIIDLVTTGGADEAVLEGIAEHRENATWYASKIVGDVPWA